MKIKYSLVLSTILLTPAVMADNSIECPTAKIIASKARFDSAVDKNGKFKVNASQDVVYKNVPFTVSLSRNLTTTTAKDALDTANDLLKSLSGPVKEHPSVFVSVGEADFVTNVCQYQTPYGITVLAKPNVPGGMFDSFFSNKK